MDEGSDIADGLRYFGEDEVYSKMQRFELRKEWYRNCCLSGLKAPC